MKFLVALAFVAIIADVFSASIKLSEDQKAKVKQYVADCIKQENISEEEAAKLHNKDFANPSERLKCFSNCFFEKVGTIKDGDVQPAVVMEKLSPHIGEEKTKAVMAKCNHLKGENKCETAYKLYECYEGEKSSILGEN